MTDTQVSKEDINRMMALIDIQEETIDIQAKTIKEYEAVTDTQQRIIDSLSTLVTVQQRELDEATKDKEHLQQVINAALDAIVEDASINEVVAILHEDPEYGHAKTKYRYKVLVVDNPGDDPVFTGWYKSYNLARESADLMVDRGCYEAWVEELQ